MSILKKLSNKVSSAELFYIETEDTAVDFESSILKSAKVTESNGVALRLIKDGKLGFSSATDLTAEDIIIESALESAIAGYDCPFEFPGAISKEEILVYDSKLENVPVTKLIEMGQELVNTLQAENDEIKISCHLSRHIIKYHLINTNGQDCMQTKSVLVATLGAERIRENDILLLNEVSVTTSWDDIYKELPAKLIRKLQWAEKEVKLTKSDSIPVLFMPHSSILLCIPIMIGVNGRMVAEKISPMYGKIGEKLFDEKLTIRDDSTLSDKVGSYTYDDEGIPGQNTILIDKGVLKNYIFDLRSAALTGTKSTGNAKRGLSSPPGPGNSNLIVEAGTTPLDEMIKSIDEGLLVESILGMGQGNILSGAFSNSLGVAYKIEKGEIVGRVKNISIAGNIYECMQNIAGISKEREIVYGGMQLPYILLDNINVTT